MRESVTEQPVPCTSQVLDFKANPIPAGEMGPGLVFQWCLLWLWSS